MLLLLMLPPCPRPRSLVVPHDPRAEYKVENNAGPLRRGDRSAGDRSAVLSSSKTTNTHEIDGIITMEYHCVLFTVLLQLIVQPGRTTFIIHWSFMVSLCFPSLEERFQKVEE